MVPSSGLIGTKIWIQQCWVALVPSCIAWVDLEIESLTYIGKVCIVACMQDHYGGGGMHRVVWTHLCSNPKGTLVHSMWPWFVRQPGSYHLYVGSCSDTLWYLAWTRRVHLSHPFASILTHQSSAHPPPPLLRMTMKPVLDDRSAAFFHWPQWTFPPAHWAPSVYNIAHLLRLVPQLALCHALPAR